MIGGGISGLTCASALDAWGVDVVVVDQGYRVGGRASTRRTFEGQVIADHGAPGFRVDHAAFGEQVSDWVDRGVCSKWVGGIGGQGLDGGDGQSGEDRFTGTPSMDAISMDLADGLDVQCQLRALQVNTASSVTGGSSSKWTVELEDREGNTHTHRCGHLVIATQAREALRLIGEHSAELASPLEQIEMARVWVLMARVIGADALDHITSIENGPIEKGPIQKVIVDHSKPGRDANEEASNMLVFHANPEWSIQHNELDRDTMKELLLGHARSLLKDLTGTKADASTIKLKDTQIHRWGSAFPLAGLPMHSLIDHHAHISICGDALGWKSNTQNPLDYGIQTAWLSGQHAAQTIVKNMT